MPLSQPVPTSNKGMNQLGFVGFFEDNHEFTRNIKTHLILEMFYPVNYHKYSYNL